MTGKKETYEMIVHGGQKLCDISPTLYGLFFEDINHAADGGIYAEMIQNRSFENFEFAVYDEKSGPDGVSSGRVHQPLDFWFGDTDQVEVLRDEGSLGRAIIEGKAAFAAGQDAGCARRPGSGKQTAPEGEAENAELASFLRARGRDADLLSDEEVNGTYICLHAGAGLINRGFCDREYKYAMPVTANHHYAFSLWAKASEKTTVTVWLRDEAGNELSDKAEICVDGAQWKQYRPQALTGLADAMGALVIQTDRDVFLDSLSLMPADELWETSPGAGKLQPAAAGAEQASGIEAAGRTEKNFCLRKDLVSMLADMKPKFLRFPGGCISEGSYIWENVYDWKDSVGPVELRKENYNVWGYTMTMGLGYYEYFRLAEDLGALPLPVMACGVLCQARSDYADPAGGSLREKYISNFTDLIDFAIGTDFDRYPWAAVRRDMGHPEPFELHYLGVGNENWGDEFCSNFEIFYHCITAYLRENYPDWKMEIVSTVGAQADDRAYADGWKFLRGCHVKGEEEIRFTDGTGPLFEKVRWYEHKSDYMNTIADEHYYRSNAYLLENADRYNYYRRENSEELSPKVFVGEYASTDVNTMMGAAAEAAMMTGFENNSDVVRLASTAPLFNQISEDGTYHWLPDCIWFDRKGVYGTPTYYVQKLFAGHIGKSALKLTDCVRDEAGEIAERKARGGIVLSAKGGRILLRSLAAESLQTGEKFVEHSFAGAAAENMPAGDDSGRTASERPAVRLPAGFRAFAGKKADSEWAARAYQRASKPTSLFSDEDRQPAACGTVSEDFLRKTPEGLIIDGREGICGICLDDVTLTDYRAEVTAVKLDEEAVLQIGCGLRGDPADLNLAEGDPRKIPWAGSSVPADSGAGDTSKQEESVRESLQDVMEKNDPGTEERWFHIPAGHVSLLQYNVGDPQIGSGLRVFKDGREGNRMGIWNPECGYTTELRACFTEPVPAGWEITATVDYDAAGRRLEMFYALAGKSTDAADGLNADENGKHAHIRAKLLPYNRDYFASVTEDEERVYIKLVNPNRTEKDLSVKLQDIAAESEAELITLTSDAAHYDTERINTAASLKEGERAVPVNGKVKVTDGRLSLSLAPVSVNIITLRKTMA